MEKRIIEVATIKIESLEKAKDVAVHGLNIKRENGLIDLEFISGTNNVKVKYFYENTSNIKDVLDSWGATTDKKQEIYLGFNMDDVVETVKQEIDEAYGEANEDNFTGEITFNMAD